MAEGLPGAARSVDTVEAAGDLVEINLRLFAPPVHHTLEVDLVAGVLGQLLRAPDGELDEFAGDGIRLRIEFVKRALAFAPRFHEPAFREQAKVRRNARLAEPRDFLQLVHGQFILLQQRDDAQPRRVGQRPQ